jgi:plasmid stabilization system protein ParE
MRFRFLPQAQQELLEGTANYTALGAALGVRFEQALSHAVRSAVVHPERGAPRSKNTRRWLVKGFPYRVIYRANESEVLIVAIAHQRRRPDCWDTRVK